MNFWSAMVVKDDYILSFVDFCLSIKSRLLSASKKEYRKKTNELLTKNRSDAGEIYVILNGPSLATQDLNVLKGKDLIFVNRGFMHPLYEFLAPKYHVFVDSKMIKGIWDIHWIDSILEKVPDITFVMPIRWASLDLFQPYIKRNVPIIWMDSGYIRGTGVSGTCFDLGLLLGYKKIYFTGFDANGFVLDLINQSSHFYEKIDDGELQSAEDIMRGYYMNARQIRELILYSIKAKKKGVEIINITNGVLLTMFRRENLLPIIANR